MTCLMMTSLGVYVLGAVDRDERRRVEAHLPQCPSCRDELIRLAPIPGLLASVPPAATAHPQRAAVARFRPPGRPRVRRLAGSLVALAACLVVVVALIVGLRGAPSPDRSRGNAAAPVTLSGISRASHVRATARLLATSWGTSIRLTIRGVPLNVRCRLVVRSRAGATETTGLWDAWRDGPITVPASAAWRPSDIASLAVVAGARTLVTIRVPAWPAPADHASRSGQ